MRTIKKKQANYRWNNSIETREELELEKNNEIEFTENSKSNSDNEDENLNENEINIMNLKNTKEIDELAKLAYHLTLKNKISSKNAFEFPLFKINELTDFKDIDKTGEWKRLSLCLASGAHIYGFKVDSVHNGTYKLIGDLFRSELNEEIIEKEQTNLIEQRLSNKLKDEKKHIEKKIESITTDKYDIFFDVDPLFQKSSAKFDESAASGLLLNNLTIGHDLKLDFSEFQDNKELVHSNKKYSKRLSQKKKYVGIEDFQDFTIPYEILKTAVLAPNVLEFMEKFEFVHEQMVDNNYKFDGFQANNDFMDNFELEDQNNHQFDLINNINEEKPVDLFMNPSNSKEKLDLSLIQKKNDLIGKGEGIPVLENQMDLNRTSKKNIINYNEINVETIPKRKRRKTFFLGKDDFITFDLIKEESPRKILVTPIGLEKKRIFSYQEPYPKNLYQLPINLNLDKKRLTDLFYKEYIETNICEVEEIQNFHFDEENLDNENFDNQIEIDQVENQNNTQNEKISQKTKLFQNNSKSKNIFLNFNKEAVPILPLKKKMLKTLNELFPKTENLLFSDLYLKIKEKFRSTGKVTEQMCFISLLHLAAENLYSLNPAFENDFYIKRN